MKVPPRISEWQIRYYEKWATGQPLPVPYVWEPKREEWVPLERATKSLYEYNAWYGTREKAESDALLVALRFPALVGRIEVVEVVHCLA